MAEIRKAIVLSSSSSKGSDLECGHVLFHASYGTPHHVMIRGIEAQSIFRADEGTPLNYSIDRMWFDAGSCS